MYAVIKQSEIIEKRQQADITERQLHDDIEARERLGENN